MVAARAVEMMAAGARAADLVRAAAGSESADLVMAAEAMGLDAAYAVECGNV